MNKIAKETHILNNVVSILVFSVIPCCHIERLLIISNFLKTEKVNVSNSHQNLDYKLIKECIRFNN